MKNNFENLRGLTLIGATVIGSGLGTLDAQNFEKVPASKAGENPKDNYEQYVTKKESEGDSLLNKENDTYALTEKDEQRIQELQDELRPMSSPEKDSVEALITQEKFDSTIKSFVAELGVDTTSAETLTSVLISALNDQNSEVEFQAEYLTLTHLCSKYLKGKYLVRSTFSEETREKFAGTVDTLSDGNFVYTNGRANAKLKRFFTKKGLVICDDMGGFIAELAHVKFHNENKAANIIGSLRDKGRAFFKGLFNIRKYRKEYPDQSVFRTAYDKDAYKLKKRVKGEAYVHGPNVEGVLAAEHGLLKRYYTEMSRESDTSPDGSGGDNTLPQSPEIKK